MALSDDKQDPVITSGPSEAVAEDGQKMATIEDDDERLLARIGYKQVCFLVICELYSGNPDQGTCRISADISLNGPRCRMLYLC